MEISDDTVSGTTCCMLKWSINAIFSLKLRLESLIHLTVLVVECDLVYEDLKFYFPLQHMHVGAIHIDQFSKIASRDLSKLCLYIYLLSISSMVSNKIIPFLVYIYVCCRQ
jgi:hypothetical protein